MKVNKRRELGEQSRLKILDAAEQLLAERGYTGMSTSRLSQASGLPAASIYWHFGNKIGVAAAVLDRRAESVFDEILDFTRTGSDPFGDLNHFIDRGVAAVSRYPHFYRLIAFLSMEVNEETAEIASTIQGIHDRAINVWHQELVRLFQPSTPAERAGVLDLAELARATYLGSVVLTPTQGLAPFNRAMRAYLELVRIAFVAHTARRSA